MGDMFSDGLTYAGAHVRKAPAIHVWAGNQGKAALRGEVNEMKSAWYAFTQVDTMAHGSVSAVSHLGYSEWSCRKSATARNKLCCVIGGKLILQHDGKMVSTKQ